MSKTNLRKCFISAPVKTDTSVLRDALEARGVAWRDAVSAQPGGSILDTIESAICDSDFVCVALSATTGVQNVLFEMGLARGLKRPLLVFAESAGSIPMHLQDVTYAKANITDKSAVDFYLDAFLQHASSKPSPRRATSSTKKKTARQIAWASRALRHVEESAAGPRQRSEALEDLVARLFAAAGFVVSRRPGPDAGVDMAVWIDELDSTIGNPLIVEIKTGRLTERALKDTQDQLRSFFPRVHARAGLIVYHDIKGNTFRSEQLTWPFVFWFSIQELIELVRNRRLATEMLRRRNTLVHGSP
jgi:hypothetical protein